MGQPVIHFEITSNDAGKLQDFYSNLFGWSVDTSNPGGYGMVDTKAERGIPGGISSPPQGTQPWLTFYVGVPDLQATLDRAVELGGKVLMPPMEVPGGDVTLAAFADPDGNMIGLSQM
jgi:predicted enzyme related to lactoylglutathione lyase